MNFPELDKPANIATIRKLHQEGLISDNALKTATAILQPAISWFSWARLMLLLLGCALILTGIVFFFAYNWAAMGHFLKFGLIELGIISCLIIAYLKNISSITGKILLLSASVLVGVLLAVFGQTYQTGADAYELFTGWAMLIFGWVVISEFAALWFIWLVLLNTAAILYWQQVGDHTYNISGEFLYLGLAAINGLALALREFGYSKGLEWLRSKWHRNLLLLAVLGSLTIPTVFLIVGSYHRQSETYFSAFAWVIAVITTYYVYRYKLCDMLAIATIVKSICIVLLTLIGKFLFSSSSDFGLFLFFALIILGVVSVAIYWLSSTAKAMAATANEIKE